MQLYEKKASGGAITRSFTGFSTNLLITYLTADQNNRKAQAINAAITKWISGRELEGSFGKNKKAVTLVML